MKKRPLGTACAVVAVLLYLFVRMNPFSCTDYSSFQGETVTVTGKVVKKDAAVQKNGMVTVLELKLPASSITESRKPDAAPPGERVLCYLKKDQPEPEIGSRVQLTGKLTCFERATNPGQFDACSYYQISGISYRITQAEIKAKTKHYNKLLQGLYALRVFLSAKIGESLPEKEASVMQAVLLGEKSTMDKELKGLYQRSGIAHILAISGLHVSMLGMGLYKFLRKTGVSMKAAAVCAAWVIFLYGAMTGFSVSAVRAIFMFVIRMGAVLAERTYDMLTSLSVAGILLLLEQPYYFYHSGFLFSFGCILGICLLLPSLLERKRKWRKTSKALAGGIGMALVSLPVYLWFYYEYPVLSILLNLIVIPLMSLLMGAGILLLGSSLICPGLGVPFALIVRGILWLYETLVTLCDESPIGVLMPGRPKEWQIILYLLLLGLIVAGRKRLPLLFKWIVAAFAVVVLLLRIGVKPEITFLDVGQGDGIFVSNGEGSCYLIDGGSSTINGVGQYRILPFLKYKGVSRLKAVFVTHPDEDHCNGIRELMEADGFGRIRIDYLVLPDIAEAARSEAYLELVSLAQQTGISVQYISRGQKIRDGVFTLECLHPGKGEDYAEENEYSTVVKVSVGAFSALLTGDVEGEGERELTEVLEESSVGFGGGEVFEKEAGSPGGDGAGEFGGVEAGGEAAVDSGRQQRLTVLKAAHHGSKNSTSEEFLREVQPVYAVISCGADNRYGHPHEELLDRLKKSGAMILGTPENGAISFYTDGEKVWVERWKPRIGVGGQSMDDGS